MIALNSQKIYPPLSWRVNSNYLPNVIRPTLVCEICYSFDLLIVLHQNQLIILVHIRNTCWLQHHLNDNNIMSGSLFVLQAHIFCNALIDSSAAFTIFFEMGSRRGTPSSNDIPKLSFICKFCYCTFYDKKVLHLGKQDTSLIGQHGN